MRRLALSLALLLAALGLAAPAGGMPTIRDDGTVVAPAILSTGATWTQSTSGPAVIWDATAFAGSTCRLVQFGGTDAMTVPAVVNLFDPKAKTWSTVTAARRASWPIARTLARMAWNPVSQRVILFGGRNSAGTALQDAWAFDPVAKTWASLTRACRRGQVCPLPPARYAHGMVWSSAIRKMVIFGGEYGMDQTLGDVWTFDGTAWQLMKTNAGPSPRFLFGMAEDAATGNIVVYGGAGTYPWGDGGYSIESVRDAQTWILDPRTATWDHVQTPTVPVMRQEMGMAYVAKIGAVVMATGGTEAGCMSWTNSAYAYDVAAKDWRKLDAGSVLPTARNAANLTANLCDGSAVLTGGTSTNNLLTLATEPSDRTWILR